MNNLLVMAMTGVLVIAAFVIGFTFGNEKAKPTLNPVKAIKEHKVAKKETEEREKQVENERIMLENIDNYDGTGANQQDLL